VWSFPLRLFVRFVAALHVFGRPSCQLALRCIWVLLLPTRLALPMLFVHFVTALRAFGHPCCELTLHCVRRPCCELALRCVRVPNLGEAVLKNLPPSQNWFLSILRLVFLPSAPLCGHFRYGSSCVSLQLIVHFVMVVRAFRYASSCIWAPILPTGLALHLGAPLSNSSCLALGRPTLARLLVHFVTALRAFGCPCCELALRCIWAPILRTHLALRSGTQPWRGRIKKSTSKPKLVLICPPTRLFASAPFVWSFLLRLFVHFVTALPAFCYGRSCVPLRLFVHLAAHLANWPCIAFGCPSCQLALPSPWSPNLGQAPRAFRYGSSCIWVPMLRSRLALRLGGHLANSPCVAFGHPTLVRPY
jgi:hypothetical protein